MLGGVSVTRGGEIVATYYDPMTHSMEGLDDGCFFCGAAPVYRRGSEPGSHHDAMCAWVDGMRLLGHELPEGHTAQESETHDAR